MWLCRRQIVANLREQRQGRFVPDNFLHRPQEVVRVPHHCLVTVPVAMHTAQPRIASSLRIQGLPTPWQSPQAHAARVVRPRCRCRQHSTIPQCEKDTLQPQQFLLRELNAFTAVGHLPQKPLVENRRQAGDVLSSAGGTRHLRLWSV